MKLFKVIALSTVLAVSAFTAVVYTSCSKDACKGVTCQNGGSCSGGTCTCKTGIGGTNCETIYRNSYAYTYGGNASDNGGFTWPSSKLIFTAGSDTTDYTKMTMQWNDNTNANIVTAPIVLNSITATGSNFTVTSTAVDTFTYTGTGTITGTTVNMTLTESHPHSAAFTITFSNFTKQ